MSAEAEAAVAVTTEPATAVEEGKPNAGESMPTAEETKAVIIEDTKPVAEESKSYVGETKPTVEEGKVLVEKSASPVGDTKPAVESPGVAAESSATETLKAAATPLSKLFLELPSIIKDADYKEMWGVELQDASHVPTTIVLEKFLRANAKDVLKAKDQLTEALRWRKKVQPAKLVEETEFSNAKFGGLGYITIYPENSSHGKEIVTWNIYGAVKDNKATFGNVEEFVEWRSALMELSVKELNLPTATEKIPEDGVDQYRMLQVHDYLNVKFLRADPIVRSASKEIIRIFSIAYPELLKEKFFVNVPLVMGWVFTVMKVFVSAETVKKFHPLSYGSSLAGEVPGWGQELPVVYGGKGKEVTEGLTVKYAAAEKTVETS